MSLEMPVCRYCRSENVNVDATAVWSKTTNEWVLSGTHNDGSYCNACDETTKIDWIPVEATEAASAEAEPAESVASDAVGGHHV